MKGLGEALKKIERNGEKITDKSQLLEYIDDQSVSQQINSGNNVGVIATIDVGIGPYGVAITQNEKKVYITNIYDETISVIDIASNKVIGNPILIEAYCDYIAMIKNTTRAYLGSYNWDAGSVNRVNTTNDKVIDKPLEVEYGIICIGVLPNGTRAYMTMPYSNSVKILNTAVNRSILPDIIVGNRPRVVVISPNGDKGYVNNYNDGTVSIFDTKTNIVTATVSLGEKPWAMAITPNGKFLYITSDPGILYVMNTTNLSVKEINVTDGFLDGIGMSPQGNRVYVSSSQSNQVMEIDTATNEIINPPFEVGDYPVGIVVTADGRYAYVANEDSDTVSVLDLKAPRGGVTV